jgi:hypothetical protein
MKKKAKKLALAKETVRGLVHQPDGCGGGNRRWRRYVLLHCCVPLQ